ncbi:MAG TPA: 16S rRNA (guanine(527)-N(7))-methyltransferase RsmG [Blastocatellia bacterium]
MSKALEDEFRPAVLAALREMDIRSLAEDALEKLAHHYRMLIEWNARLNLTRITKAEDAAKLHYAESIYAGRFLGDASTLLDAGSGAGFPAIPLAITNPALEVTALESNMKKSVFLKEAKDELGLANLRVLNARLEDIDWSGYHVVTSRALEHAADVYPKLIAALKEDSKVVLFCAGDLATTLKAAGPDINITINAVPGSKDRFIASLQRR